MPTERECVLRERGAFKAGVTAGLSMSLDEPWSGSGREAAKRYPLRVTRVVQMNFPHVVWFKVEGGALLCRAGDLDNAIKQAGDSLQGIAYVNDNQIQSIHLTRHDDPQNPRFEVTVSVVGPRAKRRYRKVGGR